MKSISLIFMVLALSTFVYSQAPNKMSFQTVVRNSQGKLIPSKSIGIRLSILKTSSTGTAVYVEKHTKTSNVNGLVTLEVGTGTIISGTFSTIDWSQGPYFLKTEMDVNGGANYTISGVTEFVSVPYALNSKNADNANSLKTLSNGAKAGDMNYWNGTAWVPLSAGSQNQILLFCDGIPSWVAQGERCPGKVTSFNCSSSIQSGGLIHGKLVNGFKISIPYSGGNGGPYEAQTISSSGVLGLTASILANEFSIGNDTLVFYLSGTPTSSGTASFSINIGGQKCVVNCPVLAGTISQLNCVNPIHEGGIFPSEPVNSLVKTIVPYSNGNGGAFSEIIISSTGVTGLNAKIVAGKFVEGDGALTVTYSGTPSTTGYAFFSLSIGGQSCSIKRMVDIKGVIGSLSCTPVNTGTLTQFISSSGVSSSYSYSNSNSGKYNSLQVASTGVSGLIATLQSGNFATSGKLIFTITGTPYTSGTAFFVLNIGGKTCTLSRTVTINQQPTSGYGPNISDIDGNSYSTAWIGTQHWMVENLKTKKYNDGTDIPNSEDQVEWLKLTSGAWVYYNNDEANNAIYGKLYNFYVVSPSSNGNKNVCPTGWHVPTDIEWNVLTGYLGGDIVAGGKMKEVGTISWFSPNEAASNESLFTGLPGGYRTSWSYYSGLGFQGYWWSSTENGTNDAWYRYLYYYNGGAFRNSYDKTHGFSVRCLRD